MSFQGVDQALDLEPIFIVGSVHSGTTLLRRIIESDPSIYATRGETSLFTEERQIAKVFKDLQEQQTREDFLKFVYCRIRLRANLVQIDIPMIRECFERHGYPKAHIADLLKLTVGKSSIEIRIAVFSYIAMLEGKGRWLEKTPSHILYMRQILPFAPSAKVVELVRDPRDVLASKKVRRDPAAGNQRAVSQNLKYDAALDSLSWYRVVQAGSRARSIYPNNILQIRYEDLVKDSVGVISQVASFLGIKMEDIDVNVPWRNSTTAEVDRASKVISDKAVGRGQRELPQIELAVCQLVNKRNMVRLGYELTEFDLLTRLRAYIALALSAFGVIRRALRS